VDDQEKQLVADILAGKQKAVREFYRKYRPRLENYLRGKVSSPTEVEEILQDTFLAALNSLPNFNFRSRLFSYLCAIANHEVADFYRRKKIKTLLFSRFPFLETLASKALTPEEEILKKELKEEIKKVLAKLSPYHRQLLRLKYLRQFSIKEIAQKLKTTPKAVESALGRARKNFSFWWKKSYSQRRI